MNELKSYTEYAVSTPTADFVIGFDFNYGEDAVNVTVDAVPAIEAGYTVVYLNETTIQLSPSVPSGVVRLQRETDIDQTDHAYRAGAKFIAQTMDENFEQLRHSQQEVRDGFVKLADDTYEIIDTLNEVGQSAQDAADAAEVAAALANNAASQVNDKVSQAELDSAVVPINTSLDLAKRGVANRYDPSLTYNSGERVVLTNGDIVKSTVDGNTVDPNVDTTGWVKTNDVSQIFDERGLSQQTINNILQNAKSKGAIGGGTLHTVNEWVVSGKFNSLAAIQIEYPHVTSLTDSIDWAVIQGMINSFLYSETSTIDPKTSPNGGIVPIPRGRYYFNKKIILKRGVRIVGESSESTQLWCLTTNGLFEYDDAGRYLSDELVIENLSLWQDASVIPTSGAGIRIRSSGLIPEASVTPTLKNLIIEGFYNNLDIGDCINLTMSNINQSKSISHGGIIDNVTFSTSSLLSSCYGHSCGDSGWLLKKMYYVSLQGMASDSNVAYGYELEDCRGVVIHGGAEANTLKALKLKNSYGTNIQVSAVNNLEGAADIDASFYTSWSCGMLTDNRAGSTKPAIVGSNGANFFEITKGVDLEGSYTTNRVVNINNYDDRALSTAIGSDGKHWQLGVNQALQKAAQFFFGGVTSSTTQNGLDVQPNFSKSVGTINKTVNVIFRAVSTDSFPVAVGVAIGNALISSGGAIARKIGQQIDKQTGGTSANAALFLSMGNALGVGNWSIFNDVDLPSYFKDKIRIGTSSATAPYIASGAGAPTDNSAPNGSLYIRTDGGTGATLYLREAGAWVAK